MASVNKILLIGNLGRDPEVRTFPDGGRVAVFSLATTETWKDKQTGERREATEWHRVVCRGGLAGIVEQYLRKGSQVYVEGAVKTRKYSDNAGVEKSITEVIADEMRMLGDRSVGSDQGAAPPPAAARAPAAAPAPAGRRPLPAPAPAPRASSGFDDMDSDIPF